MLTKNDFQVMKPTGYQFTPLFVSYAISGPIKFLTSILKKAIGSSTHRYLGLSASELAEGLTQIAGNDNNKKTVKCSSVV